jgi:dihydrofolate reductase
LIISIIVAMDRKRGIGVDNKLPWRLPADLKRFRELTMGHHIIVGRKTYESIGKPLPGRRMIIVTHNRSYRTEGCDVAYSIEEAIRIARERGESEVFICGGSEIYECSLPLAERIYLTIVDADVAADTFFPVWDEREWIQQEKIDFAADDKNQYPFTFKLLNRLASILQDAEN